MKAVPLHLWKALKEGHRIAAKIEPRFQGNVAWVWVAPYKEGFALLPPDKAPGVPWSYRVQSFEVSQELMDKEMDICGMTLPHDESYDAHSLEEVDDLVDRLVGDPSKLKLSSEWPDYFPF
jgi:hypothetical protein